MSFDPERDGMSDWKLHLWTEMARERWHWDLWTERLSG